MHKSDTHNMKTAQNLRESSNSFLSNEKDAPSLKKDKQCPFELKMVALLPAGRFTAMTKPTSDLLWSVWFWVSRCAGGAPRSRRQRRPPCCEVQHGTGGKWGSR